VSVYDGEDELAVDLLQVQTADTTLTIDPPGQPCSVYNDCVGGSCGYESFSLASSTVCCASGASTGANVTSSFGRPIGYRYFCTDQPDGTLCGETDAICLSSACVGQTCKSSKLGANEGCAVDNDCVEGSCGYESFSSGYSKVCCASGASTEVSVTSSGGWSSREYRYFCTDQPDGTLCGETDAICLSSACVGQTCKSSKLGANEGCAVDNDCVEGSCGYESFSSGYSKVCCASGASTGGWLFGYRYFCNG